MRASTKGFESSDLLGLQSAETSSSRWLIVTNPGVSQNSEYLSQCLFNRAKSLVRCSGDRRDRVLKSIL